MTRLFSPVCQCSTSTAWIRFSLRKADRVSISIVDSDGKQVRKLLDNVQKPSGMLRVVWNGRDDQGAVAPDGSYQPRVQLAVNKRTILLPNLIVLDTKPPVITLVSALPSTISPDGDRRAGSTHIRFRLSERAAAQLYIDGKRVVRSRFRLRKIDWRGKINGHVSVGVHKLQLAAVDEAGNVSKKTAPFTITVRFVTLVPSHIRVPAKKRFHVTISTDRSQVRWRFANRSGRVSGSSLTLRAPARAGLYRLVVRYGPYSARTLVTVT